jgi:Zn-dependent M28 family amino/carboxypeptidase
MTTRLQRLLLIPLLVILAGCGSVEVPSLPGSGSPAASPIPSGTAVAISSAGVSQHLMALQAIAQEHDGVRTTGTAGYTASVDYVVAQLRSFGYSVTTPVAEMSVFRELPGSVVAVEGGASFAAGDDFHAMIYSGGGDLTAPIEEVTGGEGGCEASDFDGFERGAIALVPPGGGCFRRQVVVNAQDAGAVAVISPNPSWTEGQALRPTLIFPDGIAIPAIAATGAMGDAMQEAASAGEDVHIQLTTELEPTFVHSVVAETPGDSTRVAMLGAHLDSVHDGPGINDDGSGVAALLEIARTLAGGVDGGRVRFGFWAGEEYGLYGSRAYVSSLTPDDVSALAGYLNLDMLGSLNAVPFVYDDSQAAAGSSEITDFLEQALVTAGTGAERLDLGGSSDHLSFQQAGVPTGGIFSGASELKTDEEASEFGGQADQPLDACYHLTCDTPENVDADQVATFASAAAATAMVLARGELLP